MENGLGLRGTACTMRTDTRAAERPERQGLCSARTDGDGPSIPGRAANDATRRARRRLAKASSTAQDVQDSLRQCHRHGPAGRTQKGHSTTDSIPGNNLGRAWSFLRPRRTGLAYRLPTQPCTPSSPTGWVVAITAAGVLTAALADQFCPSDLPPNQKRPDASRSPVSEQASGTGQRRKDAHLSASEDVWDQAGSCASPGSSLGIGASHGRLSLSHSRIRCWEVSEPIPRRTREGACKLDGTIDTSEGAPNHSVRPRRGQPSS